jgi:AcrR family transcriptional regulator
VLTLIPMTTPVKRATGQHHGALRAALEDAVLGLVAERGARGFTLAEASRRAGVSVAAPYKHYADRDALLTALAIKGYAEQERLFAKAIATSEDPRDQLLVAVGAYIRFAVTQRALFDVVFSAGLDKAARPELAAAASRVLNVLLVPATAVAATSGDDPTELVVSLSALAHGYAVYLREGALGSPRKALPTVIDQAQRASSRLLESTARGKRGQASTRAN